VKSIPGWRRQQRKCERHQIWSAKFPLTMKYDLKRLKRLLCTSNITKRCSQSQNLQLRNRPNPTKLNQAAHHTRIQFQCCVYERAYLDGYGGDADRGGEARPCQGGASADDWRSCSDETGHGFADVLTCSRNLRSK
jgi:hypothetical protein